MVMLFGASINNDTKCDCEGSNYNMNGMIMIHLLMYSVYMIFIQISLY